MLGIRLVHSEPYSPEGRGKQERLNRFIREAFLAEATHQGIESLADLDDLFDAWAEQVANRRIHAETDETPIERFERRGPHRAADPERLAEAFRWSVVRKVTRTATVSLEGNAYAVDPALVGRRVELRYDPEDLTRHRRVLRGQARPGWPRRSSSAATPTGPSPRPPVPTPKPTGVDYLGMVAAAHEEQAGTGTHRLLPARHVRGRRRDGGPVSAAPWVAHFGLTRTPFGKSHRGQGPLRPRRPRRGRGPHQLLRGGVGLGRDHR